MISDVSVLKSSVTSVDEFILFQHQHQPCISVIIWKQICFGSNIAWIYWLFPSLSFLFSCNDKHHAPLGTVHLSSSAVIWNLIWKGNHVIFGQGSDVLQHLCGPGCNERKGLPSSWGFWSLLNSQNYGHCRHMNLQSPFSLLAGRDPLESNNKKKPL